ncbi:uncharacterized protein LOC142355310 [Convolutriloba macropyga]|uniref:uncharacterized protein LOC142355310 n=1 Tax=Convolutriloba macropyga TaxID=536237 RepID=UPI003F521BD6
MNKGCTSGIILRLTNLKINSLGGLPDALKPFSIKRIEIKECKNLSSEEVEKLASLMNGGDLIVLRSLTDGNSQGMNVTKIIPKKNEVELRENGAVVLDKLIDLSEVNSLSIMKTRFKQKNCKIFNNGAHTLGRRVVRWASNENNPHFLETTNSNRTLVIYLEDGNKYLRKDTFMNVKATSVPSLDLQNFDRIEYGTITNGTNFRFLDIKENDKQLFTTGECTKISDLKICEVCLIHQYALRRNEDSVEQKCKDKLKIKNELQKCYWSQPESIPCSLQQSYDIFDSWIDKSVPVCTKLPQDITEHLTSVKSDEKPEICPTTTTEIPTTTSSNTTTLSSSSTTTSSSTKTTSKKTSKIAIVSLPKTSATTSKTESSTKEETNSIFSLISLLTSAKPEQSLNISKTGKSTVTRSFPTENFINSSKEITSMSLPTSVNENSTAAETTRMTEQNQTTTGNEHLFTTSMKSRPSSENEDKNVTTSKTSNSKNQSSEQESFQTSAKSDGTTTSGQQRTYTSRQWELPILTFDYGLEKQESFEASSSMIPTIFGAHVKIWSAVLASSVLSFGVN